MRSRNVHLRVNKPAQSPSDSHTSAVVTKGYQRTRHKNGGKQYILVEMLPAHIQEGSIQVTDVRIDSILDGLSLNPHLESVLRLDVIGDSILI